MEKVRHEEYGDFSGLPIVFNVGIKRTDLNYSRESNWHQDLEIELCTAGQGTVWQNGRKYDFKRGEIAVIGSDIIHYTGTKQNIEYTCLIISADYCRRLGFNIERMEYTPIIKNDKISCLIKQLATIYFDDSLKFRIAKVNKTLLEILIELNENHSAQRVEYVSENKHYDDVKAVMKYIRENFSEKITLDNISKAVYIDKYAICREFKKVTGQTVIEYANNYRCIKAAEFISQGANVTRAAADCGFENLSFFTKTFKRYMGSLPSRYKKGV